MKPESPDHVEQPVQRCLVLAHDNHSTPGDETVLGPRISGRFIRKVVNRPGDYPDLDNILIPLYLYLRATLRD